MSQLREPVREWPSEPDDGVIFAVRYVDVRGETVTRLYRQRSGAEAFAGRVMNHGGSPRTFETKAIGAREAAEARQDGPTLRTTRRRDGLFRRVEARNQGQQILGAQRPEQTPDEPLDDGRRALIELSPSCRRDLPVRSLVEGCTRGVPDAEVHAARATSDVFAVDP